MKAKIVILCVFLFFYSFVSAQSETEKATLIKVGTIIPAFTVKTLDGKTIDSKEFKSKVVLLNFWATWCPPCKKEMSFL
jgi:thiol-disulfide isomerase/thioredoxin